MPILKKCSWSGCTRILKDNNKYCTYHKKLYEKENKERYKEYKARRLHNEEQQRFQKFYNCEAWKRLRELAINDTVAIDVVDYYMMGQINQGERVHHIIELNQDFNKRLDRTNLIYLTERNHRIVHREYCNGNKAKMQELLFSLKIKFMKEFGL